MPTYTFRRIDKAGRETDELRDFSFSVADRPDQITEDGQVWRFDVVATARGVNAPSTSGYPHEFYPASVHPNRVAEARRRYPDRTYRDDGVCVTHSMSETKRIARQEGLVDMSSG